MVSAFESLPADAISVAGGKGASLGRMAEAGLPVPPGFVVCAAAFAAFLDRAGGADLIRRVTHELDVHDQVALDAASERIRGLIVVNSLPPTLDQAVRSAYQRLGDNLLVAVRSSAVCEDGEAASFAGQQETFLNVRGADAVVRRVKDCWASFFSPRALFYRARQGALADSQMAVVVQHMVLADKSGVLFTIDPVQKRRDRMVIEAVFGLGERLVSGLVTPAHYVVDRSDGSVLDECPAQQSIAVEYDPATDRTREVHLPEAKRGSRVLSDEELSRLRLIGLRLESFFGRPQDIEWCIRGDELLLLQSRPITTL